MNQIQVRIRHEDEPTAVPLCTWDATRLDELVPLIQRWGLSNRYTSADWEITGQFVIDATGAYFELMVSDPETEAS